MISRPWSVQSCVMNLVIIGMNRQMRAQPAAEFVRERCRVYNGLEKCGGVRRRKGGQKIAS